MNLFKPAVSPARLYISAGLIAAGLMLMGGAAPAGAGQSPDDAGAAGLSLSPLTLARAKEIALAQSPTLAGAKERTARALEAVRTARAAYLPTLALTSSWDYTQETDLSSPSAKEDAYSGRLTATQVLFQGFYRKYNTLSARYGEKMSREALADACRTLIWAVSQSYLNLQLAGEKIRITESDMAFNQAQLREAKAKEQIGTGSYSDVLNYRTRVNSAGTALINARQAYREYGYGLAALMGFQDARLPRGMEIQPLEAVATGKLLSCSTGQTVDMEAALAARPDLKQDRLAVEDAGARIRRARSGFFPTLTLTAAYGAGGTDKWDNLGDWDNLGSSVGLNCRFELFSGGTTRWAVRSATAEKRELEQAQKVARIDAASQIRSALDKVAAAQKTLALQTETTGLTRETRDLVKKEYDAGQVSLVRMNEAQNDLVSAQGDLADARVSLILALEELAYYTGTNIQS